MIISVLKRRVPYLIIGLIVFFAIGAYAEEIHFETSDHVVIWAKYTESSQIKPAGGFPVLILCHGMTDNYHYWDQFGKELNQSGYATLALDNRGHGHSTNYSNKTDVISVMNFKPSDYDLMPLDIKAAISWLQSQTTVDASRIGIMGESMGANLAFISKAMFPELKTAIVLSPYNYILRGTTASGPNLTKILFFCSEKEGNGESKETVERFFKKTNEPKKKRVFSSNAHGQDIVRTYPEAKQVIFEWLEKMLNT